jgi:hypothetical protein
MLRGELDATRDVLQAPKNLASHVRDELVIAMEQAQHMMNLTMILSQWVDTLQLSVLVACNAAFPIEEVDNLFIVEEHLQALPARLRAMVTEAICQGATMALVAAQLQIGTIVNLGVAEHGSLPHSTDDDIAYLIVSFEQPPTLSYRRWTWMKSCMPTLALDLWDISVVLVVVNKFDLWDTLVKYVNSYLHVGINFC